MKTNLTIVLLAATLLLSPIANAENQYPPENAALLYYRAIGLYSPADEIRDTISEVATGDASVTEDIIKHIEYNRFTIKLLVAASGIEKCNWAIDLSEGFATPMAYLSEIRNLSRLIIADARVSASKGDYKTAFKRCVTVEKMAEHVSGQTLIDGLVGISISSMSDKSITYILGEMPPDGKTLLKIKTQLRTFENRIERVKLGFEGEKILATVHLDINSDKRLSPEMLSDFGLIVDEQTQQNPAWKEFFEKVAAVDKDFFQSSKDYWIGVIDQHTGAFDLPYAQAYDKLMNEMPQKLQADIKKKPEAVLSGIMTPAFGQIYSNAVKSQNSLNALKTAVEIYLVKAKTGKLPAKIPAGLAKDLFSGKDFAYEKTDTGFILRCQAKDLSKDTIHEYEFKVAK